MACPTPQPTPLHTNGPRVPQPKQATHASMSSATSAALQHRLKTACAQLALKQQSKYNRIAIIKKLLHIYDESTGKKLAIRQLLKNPDTNKSGPNHPAMNLAV